MKKILIAALVAASFSASADNSIINEVSTSDDSSISSENIADHDFFNKIDRIINGENKKIELLRSKLKTISEKSAISQYDLQLLMEIAEKYDVDASHDHKFIANQLLLKVDVIPNSMIIAHLITELESNDFNLNGFNYFNKPCIEESCLNDINTLDYSLMNFKSVYEPIKDYMLNINTNSVFLKLREKRVLDRQTNSSFDSHEYLSFLSVFGGDDFFEAVSTNMDRYSLWKFDR